MVGNSHGGAVDPETAATCPRRGGAAVWTPLPAPTRYPAVELGATAVVITGLTIPFVSTTEMSIMTRSCGITPIRGSSATTYTPPAHRLPEARREPSRHPRGRRRPPTGPRPILQGAHSNEGRQDAHNRSGHRQAVEDELHLVGVGVGVGLDGDRDPRLGSWTTRRPHHPPKEPSVSAGLGRRARGH